MFFNPLLGAGKAAGSMFQKDPTSLTMGGGSMMGTLFQNAMKRKRSMMGGADINQSMPVAFPGGFGREAPMMTSPMPPSAGNAVAPNGLEAALKAMFSGQPLMRMYGGMNGSF